jgi:hypothetical protein
MVLAAVAALIPTPGDPDVVAQMIAGVLVAAFMLALAYGLFRGNSFARWLVIILAMVNVATGATRSGASDSYRTFLICVPLLIVGLLLVPSSSRRWFLDPPETAVQPPMPTADTHPDALDTR